MKKILTSFIMLIVVCSVFADDIAVTVYNSNLGVISENRTMTFEKGMHEISFKDVPSAIDRTSVRFELIDSKKHLSIVEQNYAYDLVNSSQMYQKYIDKKIELVDKNGNIFSGILLASDHDAVTLMYNGGRIKILLMNQITEVNFPVLPEGLITRPTLFWKYSSDFKGKADCNISYQTGGMNWSAEYVGLISSDDKELDISGWASINNQSGKTYNDATLKLIAGDINRAQQSRRPNPPMKMMTTAMDMESSGFEEKSFFEYHMYTLPRKATLSNNENKQISLFKPASTKAKKIFLYKPEVDNKKVEVALKFRNSKEFGLGMPLPAGRFRLFKADDDGSKILLGEDRISHTPKDEDVTIKVGYAFDLKAEHKLVNQNRVSKQVDEQEFEITLKNHKDEDVTIEIEKKLYGYWEITSSDFKYVKKDASTIKFSLNVTKNGSKTAKFIVRYTRR